MDLVVTTPGVPTAALRAALDPEPSANRVVFERTTRCGATTVDPTVAERLRLAVVPCAVSLHAADRLRSRFGGRQWSVDGLIICSERRRSTVDDRFVDRFIDRFGCSVVRTVDCRVHGNYWRRYCDA